MVESVQHDEVTCLEVFKRMFVIDGEGISSVSKLRIERVLTQNEMFLLRGDKQRFIDALPYGSISG
jgi:type IV secretory pathway protease TraF